MFDRKAYMKDYDKKRYRKDRKKEIKRATEWYRKNKWEILKKKRVYYMKNKERIKRNKNEWYRKNDNKLRKDAETYYKNHPKVIKNTILKNRYGVTFKEYHNLIKKQGNGCGICGMTNRQSKKKYSKRLAIDHCHTTGRIRGVLCDGCNSGIGRLRDSTKLLIKAIKYLKNSRG